VCHHPSARSTTTQLTHKGKADAFTLPLPVMAVKRPPSGDGDGTLTPGRQRQLEDLLAAAELEASDIGYLVRLLMLCTLPRTNPGKRLQYRRTNGPNELIMTATGRRGLPYGSLPRLMLAWVCTEALRTQSRELVLGRSLADFMRQLGVTGRQGGPRGNVTRVRDQMHRLFYANVRLTHRVGRRERSVSSQVTSRTDLWWDVRDPEAPMLFESTITLGAELYEEIIRHPVHRAETVWTANLRTAASRLRLRPPSGSSACSNSTTRFRRPARWGLRLPPGSCFSACGNWPC